ncbi:MAG TPA: hypothetical protein VD846_05335 [Allosphingosinicella sp.]|nr:hypothetical protein [Allosphingosinicella sp.]
MRSIVFAAACGALLCSPALAAKGGADGDSKDKVVCKAIDATSTRIARKKACMTKAQWKQYAEEQSRENRKHNRDAIGEGGNIPREF